MVDAQFTDRIHSAFSTHPHLRCGVRIEAAEGRVVLRGAVRSFYQKQMAQELLKRLDGVQAIENQLEVASW